MKENIILILADQFRADCMGYDGNQQVMTPYLDNLASEGCFFSRGYSPSPTCVPARACLVTGRKASSTGFFSNDFSVEWKFRNTLMQRLQANGYQTINVGKNHFKPQRNKLGFEINLLYETKNAENGEPSDYHAWLEQQCGKAIQDTSKNFDNNAWTVVPWTAEPRLHPTEWTVTTAIDQLQRKDPTRPFYLQVSFHRPHPPLDPPAFILDMYKDVKIQGPAVGDWAPSFDKETNCLFPFEGAINRRYLDLAKKAYYASVTHIDSQIGRLVNYLKRNKLYDNTAIIFTADHGEMMGDHNMFRKGPALEGSARIPFIVKFPAGMGGDYAGNRYGAPVSLLDIMPTCLELAGLPISEELDGDSLQHILADPESRAYVFGENYRQTKLMTTGGAFVVDKRYKYIWNSWLGKEHLFDLIRDAQEMQDLAQDPEHSEVVKRLREIVIKEYKARPYDEMLDSDGNLKGGRVLPAYRQPRE